MAFDRVLKSPENDSHRPFRQIRAAYTNTTITVYQAYPDEIAMKAVQTQRFVPPFNFDRMTWIKPSFLWMMYRSGWGTKKGQERILAIDITRSGFQWCLDRGCLSHFDSAVHASKSTWAKNTIYFTSSCPVGSGKIAPT